MCPFCTEEGLNISDLPSPSQSSLGLPSGLKGSNEGLNPEACVQFHSTPQTAAHLPSLTLLFCKRSKDATLTGVEVRNLRVLFLGMEIDILNLLSIQFYFFILQNLRCVHKSVENSQNMIASQ